MRRRSSFAVKLAVMGAGQRRRCTPLRQRKNLDNADLITDHKGEHIAHTHAFTGALNMLAIAAQSARFNHGPCSRAGAGKAQEHQQPIQPHGIPRAHPRRRSARPSNAPRARAGPKSCRGAGLLL